MYKHIDVNTCYKFIPRGMPLRSFKVIGIGDIRYATYAYD